MSAIFPIATACASPSIMTRSAILFPIISFSSKLASVRTLPSPRQAANFSFSTAFLRNSSQCFRQRARFRFRPISNSLSTPIIVSQNRGYREGYARADLSGHHGRHDWKIGIDGIFTPVYENLQYLITDPSQFDPGTQPQFHFSANQWDIESSAYPRIRFIPQLESQRRSSVRPL